MSGLTYKYILARDCKHLSEHMNCDFDARKSAIEDITFARGWANGYVKDTKKGILLANWNYMSNKAYELLKRAGYECGWSEDYELCDSCGLAIRTTHDSYCWQPEYIMGEDGMYCNNCAKPYIADHLKSLENRYKKALNNASINPEDFGYTQLQDGYESGWYGRTDDPKEILRKLQKQGKERILFQVTGVGQFSVDFAAWEYSSSSSSDDE